MDRITVDIAAMWLEVMGLPVLEIETETKDNISTHLEEKITFILEGIDKDCITIPSERLVGDGRKVSKVNRKKKGRKSDEGGSKKKI